MKTNHTPTPWIIGGSMAGVGLKIKDQIGSGAYVATLEPTPHGSPEANAAFIVKAVNTYASNTAELLAAYERIAELTITLEECREYLEGHVDVIDETQH